MSKMKELATVLDELVTCGETLISTANSLRDIFSGDADTPDSPAPAGTTENEATRSEATNKAAAPPSKNTKKPASAKATSAPAKKPASMTYTKEQVRGILAAKSAQGHGDEIRALLGKFGAKQLKQVDPSDYAALVAEAETIGTDSSESEADSTATGSAPGEEAADE